MAPIYGAYEFIVRGMLGGIGMSSFGAPMTLDDWMTPSALTSIALALLLWAYFVAIHRRFWGMPRVEGDSALSRRLRLSLTTSATG